MTELPSGAVTFLFTDIEGSTRRWQRDPSMPEVLERHDAVVRTAIEAHHGHLLKHTGDGAIAVFSSATGAVGASIEAQRAIADGVSASDPLRVRMSIHTGEAEERGGDYFGPTLNLAARLMSAGHGGQVLVSSATEELVRDRLPPGVRLIDLGEHRLPDVTRPERVFQLVSPGLDEAFPLLRTAVDTPTNLPEPRTSFVGRRRELEHVEALLGPHRLVTLLGVGGAGKTRLAIEVGRQVTHRFGDGVFLVDLSGVADGSGIAEEVARVLGVSNGGRTGHGPGGSPASSLAAFLAGRRLLLILDNCEHLLDDCAALVDLLLEQAPRITVLATSREAFALEGEQLTQVRSLSLPGERDSESSEAMELLLDRIHAVQPDLELDGATTEAMREICVRLDGIPLALELAAGRASHLAPREIADRLDDRFRLLAGGRRRAQRQQTLQAAIDWSYDLLAPDEQALLRQLSVFAGGFTLEAVEGICLTGGDGSALDLVGSLVDKSLVVGPDGGRYRLLETIRLYGEQKLAGAGESETTRARHRDWFLDLLEDQPLETCLVGEQLARHLAPETDNLWAALAWCDAEDRPDLLRRMALRVPRLPLVDPAAAPARWVGRALAFEESLPRSEWWCHVRFATIWTGDLEELDAGLERLRAITDDLPDAHPITAYAHLLRAIVLGAFPRRASEIEHAADLCIRHAGAENPLLAAHGVWLKATALLYQYRYDEGAALLETLRRSPEWDYFSPSLALVRHIQGRQREALELIGDSRSHAWGGWRRFAMVLTASVLAALGELADARRHLREAVAEARVTGSAAVGGDTPGLDPLALSDCLIGFAAVAAIEGDHERAARLVAAVPLMATSSHELFVLVRHHRDTARDHLDRPARRRCIEEGRATSVADAIDAELVRWDAETDDRPRSGG
jgi:predicted ATPase/class 3 adenylate cyclase